jgi:hypothetical protein
LSQDALSREIAMAEEDVADATEDLVRAKASLKLGQLRELQRAIGH